MYIMCHHSVCYDVNMSYCGVYVQYVCSLYYLATCVVVFSHANIKRLTTVNGIRFARLNFGGIFHGFQKYHKIYP